MTCVFDYCGRLEVLRRDHTNSHPKPNANSHIEADGSGASVTGGVAGGVTGGITGGLLGVDVPVGTKLFP